MLLQSLTLFFLNVFTVVLSSYAGALNSQNAITPKAYAIWRNATVPFYVDPQHFDHEQTISILAALSMFSFKTCLKFKPVMARPVAGEDVMMFSNPDGVRRCNIQTMGHSVFDAHLVRLGYDCLKLPQIDMMIMKALGFPFEHNRVIRDFYIDVLHENIEPGYIELFTKEDTLPLELKFLPYDINSVMHFENREYSKNGHRTLIFKDPKVQQNRYALTETDLKKIEIVYGPECRLRDRQEKIQLCQSYPGVARKKRETGHNALDNEKLQLKPNLVRRKRELDLEALATKSLRVNPNITPPPVNLTNDTSITQNLRDLGIDKPVQEILEQAHKVSTLALKIAREKYCNNNSAAPEITEAFKITKDNSQTDVLGIIEVVENYAKGMVDDAVRNLTKFCEESQSIEVYQRARGGCNWDSRDPRCRQTNFKSTNIGNPRWSTQHRPVPNYWPTKHVGGKSRNINYGRAMNSSRDSEEATTEPIRIKRDATTKVAGETEGTITKLAAVTDGEKKEEPGTKVESGVGNVNEEVGQNKAEVVREKKAEITENKGEAASGSKTNAEEKKDEANVETGGKLDDKSNLRRHNRRSNLRKGDHRFEENSEDEVLLDVSVELERPAVNTKDKDEQQKMRLNKNNKMRRPNREENKRGRERYREQKKSKPRKPAKLTDSDRDTSAEGRYKHSADKNRSKPKKRRPVKEEEEEDDEEEEEEEDDERLRKPKKKLKREKQSSFLPKTVPLSPKNEEYYKERRWPKGNLIYAIKEDTSYDLADMRSRLKEVSEILKRKTCVRMKEVSLDAAKSYVDYIVIDDSPDYVTGRVGESSLEMFRGGQHRQHTAMMVMAMLGFYFEVSRHDRDKYIRVHMRHVRPDKLHHFEMIRSDATLPLPYDYTSATHPAWQFWRQIGRTGISTVATFKEIDPKGTIMQSLGQNEKLLSDNDIVKINSVYGVECFHRSRAIDGSQRPSNDRTTLPSSNQTIGL